MYRQPLQPKIHNGGGFGDRQQDYTYGRNANYTPRNGEYKSRTNSVQNHPQMNDEFAFMPDDPSDGFFDDGTGNNGFRDRCSRPQYQKVAKRSVILANLPENPTHQEIIEVVRGGMLLDIYVRTYDKTASISFLEEIHAHEFFRYVKRHDLYIRGKRVCFFSLEICPCPVVNSIRLIFVGTNVSLSCLGTLRTKFRLEPRETLSFIPGTRSTRKKLLEMTWSISITWL